MSIYSISRARVQYLGSSVPLLRFKHCLFEALMSSIHQYSIKPVTKFKEDELIDSK